METCCSIATSRRELLKKGALGLAWGLGGLSLVNQLFLERAYGVPQQRSSLYDAVVQVFYEGGPSQTDTWDPKPGRPNNVFRTIPLGVNDVYNQPVHVAEHFPRIANLVTGQPSRFGLGLIRSVSHPNLEHFNAQMWMNCFWQDSGSVAAYPSAAATMAHLLHDKVKSEGLPPSVVLRPGTTGVNEARTSSVPTALSVDAGGPDMTDALTAKVDPRRADRRRALTEVFNERMRATRPDATVKAYEDAWTDALELTRRGRAAAAFDLTGKPILPGDDSGGACTRLTLAQELVRQGVPYVSTAIFGNDDSHGNNVATVTKNWGNITDPAVSQLASNLAATGKKVLVVMFGEFGRTPILNGSSGRDHFASGFSCALLSVNQPLFKTTAWGDTGPDGMAGAQLRDPVAPSTLGALVYRAVGIPIDDPRSFIPMPQGPRCAVDPTLAGRAPALMAGFGLPPI